MNNETSKNSEPMAENPLLSAAFEFRQLEWEYFNPAKISNSFQKIVAQNNFTLPEWIAEKKECSIDITEAHYSRTGKVYCATIWWFNRGVSIVQSSEDCKTINDCIDLVNVRLFELGTLFLGCRYGRACRR